MKALIFAGVLTALGLPGLAQDNKPFYTNDFEQAALGKPSSEFLMEGEFEVKAEAGNKFLELPGAPLDTFFLVFGPSEKGDVAVSARINGTAKGRRSPSFGVGLNGQTGYKLQVSPGKNAIEICKGDGVIATTPFTWKSGEWTRLLLQIRKAGDVWKVEGKAWQGTTEPAQMTVTFDEKAEPSGGRASIWGMPFSTTPIQFDDLVVKKAVAP